MRKALLAGAIAIGLCIAGCSSSMKLHMDVNGIGDYEVIECPKDFGKYSKQDNEIEVTVKKDGDYKFVVKGEDGQEHTFTLKVHDGKAEIAETDLSITLGSIK